MGMTLWIALAGSEPWPELNDAQLVTKILHDRLPPLAQTGARVTEGLDAIVQKACARDPAQRYPTASAMGSAIAAFGRDTGWMATHVEVAEFVEELCGERLERLRGEVRDSHVSLPPPAIGSASAPAIGSASLPVPGVEGSRNKWSAVGVQRIRVLDRNATGSEDPTQLEVAPVKGTLVGIGPAISAGRGGTVRVAELANAPATASAASPPPARLALAPAEDGVRRTRARHVALVVIGIAMLLLAAAFGAWASRSGASRADAPEPVFYG
jgi:hypothetical protein